MLLRGLPLLMALYRMWRRLPAKQRRQVIVLAGRHGPRVASRLMRLRNARVSR
jgi:hypothetical protein